MADPDPKPNTQGYLGVACIITGSSAEHIEYLRTRPGVDFVVCKGFNFKEVANTLRTLVTERRNEQYQ